MLAACPWFLCAHHSGNRKTIKKRAATMRSRSVSLFLFSAGVLLLVTGVAKLISGFGDTRALAAPDPLLSLPYRFLFWGVGILEVIVAAVCFFAGRTPLKAGLVAWLATNFLVYRVGQAAVGYDGPCACLGSLTAALHISPHAADNAMRVVLAYLLVGSYTALFWLWKQKRKASPGTPLSRATATL
jgi:Methylamine utilisation protein MauE